MGTICTAQHEGENYRTNLKHKNTVTKSETEQDPFSKIKHIGSTELGPYATITTTLGHYSQQTWHENSTLLCLTTMNSISFCEELREYAHDSKAVIEKIKNQRSIKNYIKVKKGCPYQRVCVCVIPEYSFKEAQENQIYEYSKNFRVLIRSLCQQMDNITLYITQTSGEGMVFPTQTVLALLFKELCTCLQRKTSINMMTPEPKILQMIKYELLKTEACSKTITDWNLRYLPGPITLNQV